MDLSIRVEIEELLGRYCDSVLRLDLDVFAATWCEHATWSIPGSGVITGRDAIVETFAEIRGGYARCLQQILNGRSAPWPCRGGCGTPADRRESPACVTTS